MLHVFNGFKWKLLAPRCIASKLFSSPEIRCTGICLKLISFLNRSRIRHPLASGSFTSSVTAIGLIFISEIKYFSKISCDHYFQIHFMRFFHHDLCKPNIIFNNQHYLIITYNIVPVITHFINDLIQYIQVFCFSLP